MLPRLSRRPRHAVCSVRAALLRFMYCFCVNQALKFREMTCASRSSWRRSSSLILDMARSSGSVPHWLMTFSSSASGRVPPAAPPPNEKGSFMERPFLRSLMWSDSCSAHLSCSDSALKASCITGSCVDVCFLRPSTDSSSVHAEDAVAFPCRLPSPVACTKSVRISRLRLSGAGPSIVASSARWPRRLRGSAAAPFESSSSTMGRCPARQARCSGVSPSSLRTSMLAP
mmetsp:Transcript_39935/g.124929  ORF Transcript_39935/g.124929 Transcript_39935/m.124929 type:complete len:229 (+) Transcript_39935:433-1119(+)